MIEAAAFFFSAISSFNEGNISSLSLSWVTVPSLLMNWHLSTQSICHRWLQPHVYKPGPIVHSFTIIFRYQFSLVFDLWKEISWPSIDFTTGIANFMNKNLWHVITNPRSDLSQTSFIKEAFSHVNDNVIQYPLHVYLASLSCNIAHQKINFIIKS